MTGTGRGGSEFGSSAGRKARHEGGGKDDALGPADLRRAYIGDKERA